MAGEIVHIEFVAKDADRAAAFWGGVFGWEFGDSMSPDFVYRMARTGENSGAAITQTGDPGHPTFYFDTPNIDASMAKVRELGGEAGDKTPVPTHGWYSACKDSEGNAFHLWQGDASAA
jgi:predicted enzyme related to lactoylglutathione lyase